MTTTTNLKHLPWGTDGVEVFNAANRTIAQCDYTDEERAIADAVNEIPALIARAESLEADNARLREALEQCEYALRCLIDGSAPDAEHPWMVSTSVTPGLWSRCEVALYSARAALSDTGKGE